MNSKNLPGVVVGALVVVGVLVVLGVPLERLLPWALVLACPLMMLVMMGGKHDHSHSEPHDRDSSGRP